MWSICIHVCMTEDARRPPPPTYPAQGSQEQEAMPGFFMGAGDSSSDPHVYKASPLTQ